SVVVSWTPARPSAVLRELEIWGRSDGIAGGAAGAILPDALYTGTPAGAVEARAREGEQTIAPSRPPATFKVNLDGDPRQLERAFIVYELSGLPHFTAAVRAINGHRAAGRFGVSLGAKGGMQVEEIAPAWLAAGANRIDFLPADDRSPASYRVSGLRIVGIPGAGARLDDAGARTWIALRDGREGTGWQAPATKKGGAGPAPRDWTLASPAQPRTLDFRLPGRGAGTLTIGAGDAASKSRVTVA